MKSKFQHDTLAQEMHKRRREESDHVSSQKREARKRVGKGWKNLDSLHDLIMTGKGERERVCTCNLDANMSYARMDDAKGVREVVGERTQSG